MALNMRKVARIQGPKEARRAIFRLFVLFFLSAVAIQAYAEVYKWVDDQGRVHFSDRPTSAQSTEVKIKQQEESQPPAGDSDRRLKMQRMLDVYAEDRAEKKEAMQKQQDERKQRRQNCARAKDRYNSHIRASGIYEYGKDGGRRYLSDEERSRHMKKLKAEIDRWCK
jgi:hypothetical protein